MLAWAALAIGLASVAVDQSSQPSSALAEPCSVDTGAPAPAVAIGRAVQPRVRKQVIADPPHSFLDAGVDGRVVVSATVDTDGSTCDIRVVESSPQGIGLEEAGIASAKSWRFTAASKDGTPVRAPVTIAFTYSAYKNDLRRPGVRTRGSSADITGADPLPPGSRPVP